MESKTKKKKSANHVGFRNQNLFCMHCGDQHQVHYPLLVEEMIKLSEGFADRHADCKKTWQQPMPHEGMSNTERAKFWWDFGERGSSSETMYHRMMGITRRGKETHPLDPDDFRRCYLFLKFIPEWRKNLVIMKDVSPQWANLVDNWDRLTEMLEEQIKTGKTNGMYEFMQKLIEI